MDSKFPRRTSKGDLPSAAQKIVVPPKPVRAARRDAALVYLRYSTTLQEVKSEQRQIDDCLAYAQAKHLRVLGVFYDRGLPEAGMISDRRRDEEES